MVEKYMPEAIANRYLWHMHTQREIDEQGRSWRAQEVDGRYQSVGTFVILPY